jgi:tRNA A37 N6-isopentenylltransferase MiaA
MPVFVLLFNVGTDNEGLHSLRIGDQDVVLMFEDEDDATRYALLLEAQDFATPAVEAIEQAEIEEFCQGSGYLAQLVPAGFVPQSEAERLLMAPPEHNVEETDWQLEGTRADKDEASDIAKDDLERIRRQLEGLL